MSASSEAPRACVLAPTGPVLTAEEAAFFREAAPAGFCLFRRNCETPGQLSRLTAALRESVGRPVPILVDQEGGRVQRLRPPAWPNDPAPARLGALHALDPESGRAAAAELARAMAIDLAAAGIDVDATPVLDLARPTDSTVIGDRAFDDDPERVIALGRAVVEGLAAGGVAPVIKHLPGHGRGIVDSHHALPVVEASAEDLAARDFRPFAALADLPWGMTAHILFPALDPDRPATLSPRVIAETIRGAIGFDGVLVSDDLSMGALQGSIGERAAVAVAAGCDLALHCNGDLAEMRAVAAAVPRLSAASAGRLDRAIAWQARAAAERGRPDPTEAARLRARVAERLSVVEAAEGTAGQSPVASA
ncbi:MAG: beta-N-acetylhexosaminidase [Azospirillaceae bacterium]